MAEQKIKSASGLGTEAATVFQRYAPSLHRYLTKRVRNPANTPDLMQDIFERFLQLLNSGEAVINPEGCLYGIARNRVKEYWYAQSHSRVAFDSDAVDAAADQLQYSSPDDLALRLALQEDLRDALLQLPPVHQAVLLLVKRDGLSYAEVATKTGLTVSTVTKYLFEARVKVKMLLKREP
jgi:RNA polymerase sigma factor (sigma-70 family)